MRKFLKRFKVDVCKDMFGGDMEGKRTRAYEVMLFLWNVGLCNTSFDLKPALP